MRVFLSSLFFILFITAESRADNGTVTIDALRSIIAERLALMPDVARHKWNHELPVEDLAREAVILEATVKKAQVVGLERAYAVRVVSAQMTASKRIQSQLIEAWQKADAVIFEAAPDLATDIRPKIGAITPKLLALVYAAKPALSRCSVAAKLMNAEDTGVAPAVWKIATEAMVDEKCLEAKPDVSS
jgi:chorismate mutase-like protein